MSLVPTLTEEDLRDLGLPLGDIFTILHAARTLSGASPTSSHHTTPHSYLAPHLYLPVVDAWCAVVLFQSHPNVGHLFWRCRMPHSRAHAAVVYVLSTLTVLVETLRLEALSSPPHRSQCHLTRRLATAVVVIVLAEFDARCLVPISSNDTLCTLGYGKAVCV